MANSNVLALVGTVTGQQIAMGPSSAAASSAIHARTTTEAACAHDLMMGTTGAGTNYGSSPIPSD